MEDGWNVRAISECFIKPKNVDEESKKPFYLGPSELVQMSHSYLQKGLLFDRFPEEEDGNMSFFLGRLTQTLSSTLDHFYPLAGQLVTKEDVDKHESLIFVDYNKGPGAKFIHAILDNVTVNDILSPTYVPINMVQSFFELGRRVPTNYDGHDEPLLVIQVTELVDGIFLGISANHVVVDGTMLWNFLLSWSEIFHSNDTKISRPPLCNRWFPEGYGPMIKIPNTQLDELRSQHKAEITNPIREMIFHLSHEAMTRLKAKANADCAVANKISSFQALSALIWRSIARARRRHGLGDDEKSLCMIIANARSRLVPPLSQNYFGSFIHPAMKHIKVSSLLENSLGWVALLLQQEIAQLTDEHLRDAFLKWIKSPFFFPTGPPSSSSILISGTPKEDEYSVEFGLGKAVAVRTAGYMYDGKVVLHPGKEGDGSVSVEIYLPPHEIIHLQQDEEFVSFLSSNLT